MYYNTNQRIVQGAEYSLQQKRIFSKNRTKSFVKILTNTSSSVIIEQTVLK